MTLILYVIFDKFPCSPCLASPPMLIHHTNIPMSIFHNTSASNTWSIFDVVLQFKPCPQYEHRIFIPVLMWHLPNRQGWVNCNNNYSLKCMETKSLQYLTWTQNYSIKCYCYSNMDQLFECTVYPHLTSPCPAALIILEASAIRVLGSHKKNTWFYFCYSPISSGIISISSHGIDHWPSRIYQFQHHKGQKNLSS